MNINRLDHLVLTVKDIAKTVQFYVSVPGMEKEEFGAGRLALKYGNQKINLHQVGKEFEPKAGRPASGSAFAAGAPPIRWGVTGSIHTRKEVFHNGHSTDFQHH